jgi:hypothetical protein
MAAESRSTLPEAKNAEAGVVGTVLMCLGAGDEDADDAAPEKVARLVGEWKEMMEREGGGEKCGERKCEKASEQEFCTGSWPCFVLPLFIRSTPRN